MLLRPRPGRWLQLASYLAVLAIFLSGGFFFFQHIFAYLLSLESLGLPLTARILNTAFLAFLLMLFLSSLVTSLSVFYHSPEIDFLLAAPLPGYRIFGYRLIYNTVYSTWATLLLGLPLLAALLYTSRASALRCLAVALGFPLFLLIPSLLAVAVLLSLIALFPRLSHKRLLCLVFLTVALAINSPTKEMSIFSTSWAN